MRSASRAVEALAGDARSGAALRTPIAAQSCGTIGAGITPQRTSVSANDAELGGDRDVAAGDQADAAAVAGAVDQRERRPRQGAEPAHRLGGAPGEARGCPRAWRSPAARRQLRSAPAWKCLPSPRRTSDPHPRVLAPAPSSALAQLGDQLLVVGVVDLGARSASPSPPRARRGRVRYHVRAPSASTSPARPCPRCHAEPVITARSHDRPPSRSGPRAVRRALTALTFSSNPGWLGSRDPAFERSAHALQPVPTTRQDSRSAASRPDDEPRRPRPSAPAPAQPRESARASEPARLGSRPRPLAQPDHGASPSPGRGRAAGMPARRAAHGGGWRPVAAPPSGHSLIDELAAEAESAGRRAAPPAWPEDADPDRAGNRPAARLRATPVPPADHDDGAGRGPTSLDDIVGHDRPGGLDPRLGGLGRAVRRRRRHRGAGGADGRPGVDARPGFARLRHRQRAQARRRRRRPAGRADDLRDPGAGRDLDRRRRAPGRRASSAASRAIRRSTRRSPR